MLHNDPPVKEEIGRDSNSSRPVTTSARIDELSPPLPWDPIPAKPAHLSKRALAALAIEREKRGHYRRRLTEELPINSRDWCLALIGAVERARGICERCPAELENDMAAGSYPIKCVVADWLEVAEAGLQRLRKAVEARAAMS